MGRWRLWQTGTRLKLNLQGPKTYRRSIRKAGKLRDVIIASRDATRISERARTAAID